MCGKNGNSDEIRGIINCSENSIYLTCPGNRFNLPQSCEHHICTECLAKFGWKPAPEEEFPEKGESGEADNNPGF